MIKASTCGECGALGGTRTPNLLIRSYRQVPPGQPYTHVRPSTDVRGHPPERTPVAVLSCCTALPCGSIFLHTFVPFKKIPHASLRTPSLAMIR